MTCLAQRHNTVMFQILFVSDLTTAFPTMYSVLEVELNLADTLFLSLEV